MNNFKNFTHYIPGEEKADLLAAGVGFLQDENGNDWYECQKLFADNTYKISYDSDNIIRSITTDVSALYPVNASVAELDELPEGCDITGRWKYDNGEVVDTMTPEKAIKQKTAEINTWRDEQEQGNVTFEVEGYHWDASLASLTRIEPVMTLVTTGVLPSSFFWTDANNEDIPATAELLAAIYKGMQQALVVQGFKIHERQRQMKQEVAELATVAEIEAYKVGWGEDETTAA